MLTPVLWPPHAKSSLIGKDSDAGKDWGQEEKRTTDDEMAGWHHWLNGWVWVNSGSWWWTGRPGVLRFMGLQRVGHDWSTELNWTVCVCMCVCVYVYVCVCVHALNFSVLSDSCNPLDSSLSGSFVHVVFQASILEWITISFSSESSLFRNRTRAYCIGMWILYHQAT